MRNKSLNTLTDKGMGGVSEMGSQGSYIKIAGGGAMERKPARPELIKRKDYLTAYNNTPDLILAIVKHILDYKRAELEAQKEIALEKLELEGERLVQNFQRQVAERDYIMGEVRRVLEKGLETGDNALVFRALDVFSDLIKNPPGRE